MLLYFRVCRNLRFVITWRLLVVKSLVKPFTHLQTFSFVLRSAAYESQTFHGNETTHHVEDLATALRSVTQLIQLFTQGAASLTAWISASMCVRFTLPLNSSVARNSLPRTSIPPPPLLACTSHRLTYLAAAGTTQLSTIHRVNIFMQPDTTQCVCG